MRETAIRICQILALLVMFGLGAWLLERVYSGLMRHHHPRRTPHPVAQISGGLQRYRGLPSESAGWSTNRSEESAGQCVSTCGSNAPLSMPMSTAFQSSQVRHNWREDGGSAGRASSRARALRREVQVLIAGVRRTLITIVEDPSTASSAVICGAGRGAWPRARYYRRNLREPAGCIPTRLVQG